MWSMNNIRTFFIHFLPFPLCKDKLLLLSSAHVLVPSRLTHSIIWLTKPRSIQLCSRLQVDQFIKYIIIYKCMCCSYNCTLGAMLICVSKTSVTIAKNRAMTIHMLPIPFYDICMHNEIRGLRVQRHKGVQPVMPFLEWHQAVLPVANSQCHTGTKGGHLFGWNH